MAKRSYEGQRARNMRARARKSGDRDAELIRLADIGDRDGWVCQICFRQVDQAMRSEQRWSGFYPTLDHIMPLEQGGKHTPANVQLTHKQCNEDKDNFRPEEWDRVRTL